MLYSHIYSQPSDQDSTVQGSRLLQDHLREVGQVLRDIIAQIGLSLPFKEDLVNEIAFVIGATHDFGKATIFFQKDRLLNKRKTRDTHHSLLSSLVTFTLLEDLLKDERIPDPWRWFIPLMGFQVVSKHHGSIRPVIELEANLRVEDEWLQYQSKNLDSEVYSLVVQSEFGKVSFQSLAPLEDKIPSILESISQAARKFKKILRRGVKETNYDDLLDLSLVTLIFYSALLEADRALLILEETEYYRKRPTIIQSVETYRTRNFITDSQSTINRLREKAFQAVLANKPSTLSQEGIYTITLPTGLGKTLLSFRLAEMLRESQQPAPRVVYSLPFLSVIDQTHDVLEEVFHYQFSEKVPSDVLLTHHSLSQHEYETDDEQVSGDFSKTDFLITLWRSEVILTTFDQLLYTIFGESRLTLMRLSALSNAFVILDEIQAIPYTIWYLIREVFQAVGRLLGTKFLFMTATQPLIFPQKHSMELVPNPSFFYKQLARTELDIDLTPMVLSNFVDFIRTVLDKNPAADVMVVLNTINSSLILFEELMECQGQLFYLSANVPPRVRRKRINSLRKNRQPEEARRVLIATQVIEAGVDVDFEIVVRDYAPLDSILQAAGRCNRHGRSPRGTVYIRKIVSEYQNRSLASFVYRDEDNILLDITELVLSRKRKIDEREFHQLGMDYFQELNRRKFDSKAKDALRRFIQLDLAGIRIKTLLRGKEPQATIYLNYNEETANILEQTRQILEISSWQTRKQQWTAIRSAFAENCITVRPNNGTVQRKGIRLPLNAFADPLSEKHSNLWVVGPRYCDEQLGLVLDQHSTTMIL